MHKRAVPAVLMALIVAASWASEGRGCGTVQKQACSCCGEERTCTYCGIKPAPSRDVGVLQAAPMIAPAAGFAVPLPIEFKPDEAPAAAYAMDHLDSHGPPIYLALSQFLS